MATKMRLIAYIARIAGSILAAVALWGCQETPTEPSSSRSLTRAAVRTFGHAARRAQQRSLGH
jgi:hypothetical protein